MTKSGPKGRTLEGKGEPTIEEQKVTVGTGRKDLGGKERQSNADKRCRNTWRTRHMSRENARIDPS